ncbi:hypothetical protein R6Q59_023646 [Mikania micrantha]
MKVEAAFQSDPHPSLRLLLFNLDHDHSSIILFFEADTEIDMVFIIDSQVIAKVLGQIAIFIEMTQDGNLGNIRSYLHNSSLCNGRRNDRSSAEFLPRYLKFDVVIAGLLNVTLVILEIQSTTSSKYFTVVHISAYNDLQVFAISEILDGVFVIDVKKKTLDNIYVTATYRWCLHQQSMLQFSKIKESPGIGTVITASALDGLGFDFNSCFLCPKLGINQVIISTFHFFSYACLEMKMCQIRGK